MRRRTGSYSVSASRNACAGTGRASHYHRGMRFAKGHGTENDFVLLPDFEDDLALTPALVTRLCDRRAGLGGDGVLRIVLAAAQSAGGSGNGGTAHGGTAHGRTAHGGTAYGGSGYGLDGPDEPPAEWFMDYRNADGSIAEICGNGIRVFARYLLDHGLVRDLAFTVGTRSGPRQVRAEPDGSITAEMGVPAILGTGRAVIGGLEYAGLRVSLGNPHLAVLVSTPVAAFDLSAAPLLDPAEFPQGANVEVVRVTGRRQAEMRVYERGSGPTRSCGTGAVAAAVAAAIASAGPGAGAGAGPGAGVVPAAVPETASGTWTVEVPGGRLAVTLVGTASLLTGPAVIVAEGELDDGWLSGADGS
jgi:diaminopimelate epimerase